MRILLLLFALGLPAWASPSTSDADLKSAQVSITIDSQGIPQGYTGAVSYGEGTVDASNAGILASASLLHGDLSAIYGCSFGPTVHFDSTSSGTCEATGSNGEDDALGGGNGIDAVLTEGPMLVSDGTINGGAGGHSDFGQSAGNGGNVTVYLDGSKTSWSSLTLNGGNPNAALGGNAQLILNSTQTTATLNIADNGGAGDNATSGLTYVTISGSGLATVDLTYVNNSGLLNQQDFSGCVLVQASVDAILVAYSTSYSGGAPQPANGGSLINISGGCASPSSMGANAATVLASNGIIVYTN